MRKFNIGIFKEYLNREIRERKLRRDTADSYVRMITKLNESLPDEFTCKELAERIDYLSGKTQVRKYINAVKKYERGVTGAEGTYLYGGELKKLYKKYKPGEVVEIRHEIDTYNRKINGLSNKDMQMKLALRLQFKTGLRVSEVAALKKENVRIVEDEMQVEVINGKGGKNRMVTALDDRWLREQLTTYMKSCDRNHLFPQASEIEQFASKIDIKTHELRKAYARVLFRQKRGKGLCKTKAKKLVGVQLGHEGPKASATTNLYLGKEYTNE